MNVYSETAPKQVLLPLFESPEQAALCLAVCSMQASNSARAQPYASSVLECVTSFREFWRVIEKGVGTAPAHGGSKRDGELSRLTDSIVSASFALAGEARGFSLAGYERAALGRLCEAWLTRNNSPLANLGQPGTVFDWLRGRTADPLVHAPHQFTAAIMLCIAAHYTQSTETAPLLLQLAQALPYELQEDSLVLPARAHALRITQNYAHHNGEELGPFRGLYRSLCDRISRSADQAGNVHVRKTAEVQRYEELVSVGSHLLIQLAWNEGKLPERPQLGPWCRNQTQLELELVNRD
jgi:hypothetical protein